MNIEVTGQNNRFQATLGRAIADIETDLVSTHGPGAIVIGSRAFGGLKPSCHLQTPLSVGRQT